jgi:hypothetical protein
MTKISLRLPRGRANAINRPSGDHAGAFPVTRKRGSPPASLMTAITVERSLGDCVVNTIEPSRASDENAPSSPGSGRTMAIESMMTAIPIEAAASPIGHRDERLLDVPSFVRLAISGSGACPPSRCRRSPMCRTTDDPFS